MANLDNVGFKATDASGKMDYQIRGQRTDRAERLLTLGLLLL